MRTNFMRIVGLMILAILFRHGAGAQPSRMFTVTDSSERRVATDRLVNEIAHEQPGGVGGDGNDAKNELLDLSPVLTSLDFSSESRRVLELAFRNDPSKENLLLAAMAGVPSIDGDIEKLAKGRIEQPQSGKFYGSLSWAANLVRARRGNNESLQKVLQASRQADTHSQVVFLLRELAYVPQPAVAEYIAEFVFSEGRLEPLKATVDGMPYAQYAAAALSRMLVGCPVAYKEDYSYSREEISVLRDWLRGKKLDGRWQFRASDRSQ